MTQQLLFSETAARGESLDRVLDNAGDDWKQRAFDVVRQMSESEATGEDIRLACEAEGVFPHNNNAWGGLVNHLIRDGLLLPTGRYRPMRAPGSHARKTQIYLMQ